LYYYRYSSAGFAGFVGFVGKQNTRTNVDGWRRKTNKAGGVLISTNVPIVNKE